MERYRALCEVCEKPIPEGQEVIHAEEGDSYCARCVVDLIGAERDDAQERLRGAVDLLEQAVDLIAQPTINRDRAREWMADVDALLGDGTTTPGGR